MKYLLLVLLLAPLAALHAADLTLTSPRDFQVVQRATPTRGLLKIAGQLPELVPGDAVMEARLVGAASDAGWQRLNATFADRTISGVLDAAAGGWWRLEVRVSHGGKAVASGAVEHVGVGEVFVIAGQSNSANHGQEKQKPQSGRVATFDGTSWRLADDPQPGASGGGGSFIPPFADAVVAKQEVPVGIIACGIGATSVREWLPKGATFPNPPTIERRVEKRPDGTWASQGAAYDAFVARLKPLGPQGFRAVLWHQGESDANQKDTSRTLAGPLYREYLEKLIRDSRRAIGWEAPWFVAQASYHVPGDEGSADIRAAQASLWKDGIALAGPDSDALKGELRERNGQGVHFSGQGLREHGAKWAEKVVPWLDQQWTAPRRAHGGTEWSRYEHLPECHSIGWVSANVQSKDTQSWNGVLDEAKWGTPAPQQVVARNWDWKISAAQWAEAVKQKGEGKREEVKWDLWLPDGVSVVKGIVVMSGHGSGENLFRRADLRALAQELHLALFKFVGNPVQRGFWPSGLLFDRLQIWGEKTGHPELGHAPLFLYGHSNGTGFSAVFPASAPDRVWGWVSMRPGITFQVYQPGAAQVPGLVIFGEDDPFLARPSKEENLAVVPTLRKNHAAVWSFAVEPKTGHGPGEKTWPLVFSFLRHSFAARVPAAGDARQNPVKLNSLPLEKGHLGQNWDPTKGGYQTLTVTPFAAFKGNQATASWLINAAFATDWQAFQREGKINAPPAAIEPSKPATAPASAPVKPPPAKRLTLAEQRAAAAQHAVRIPSSIDGSEQLVIWHCPESAARDVQGQGVPLLVYLHSWSGGFEQGVSLIGLAKKMGWVLVAPDFRGPNNRPEACASELASQDILDAVDYAKKHARIDSSRIILLGGSGGGHMALVMAARAPQVWAGVSAWVPISDLAAWHAESTARKTNYAKMLEQSCGGPPSPTTESEYRKRSPLFHLAAAKAVPLDINTGIHDGHTGSVPVSHSLYAFNALAAASGHPERKVSEADIRSMVKEQKIPAALASETQTDPERQKPVLFRRIASQARITVFEGGHDSEPAAAIAWLARQRRGQAADFTLGSATSAAAEAVGK